MWNEAELNASYNLRGAIPRPYQCGALSYNKWVGVHVVERLNCQWWVSDYLDGHGTLEMQPVILNSSICTATNVTTCVVSHGMVCTRALSVLIVSIATCELFHALHGLHMQ